MKIKIIHFKNFTVIQMSDQSIFQRIRTKPGGVSLQRTEIHQWINEAREMTEITCLLASRPLEGLKNTDVPEAIKTLTTTQKDLFRLATSVATK
jgi:hypothetical protein